MKKQHITGTVFKALLLGSVLVGCQQEEMLTPEVGTATSEDANAKINAELKLIKEGQNTIQYIKQGRDTGKLSKVSGPNQYTNYTYADGTNPGEVWITSKTYAKSTDALLKEVHYFVSNGKCLQSQDVTNNHTLEYKYNEVGRLDQIKYAGTSTKIDLTYDYDSNAGVERLVKMVHSNANGAYKQTNFYYTVGMVPVKKDKYSLYNEHTELDRYLPIFGKLSDLLVQRVVITPLPYNNQSQPCYRYFYDLNSDGYATYIQRIYFPIKENVETGKQTSSYVLNYSTFWQGV